MYVLLCATWPPVVPSPYLEEPLLHHMPLSHSTFDITGELNIMHLGSLRTVPIFPLKHPLSICLNTVHCDGKCFFFLFLFWH